MREPTDEELDDNPDQEDEQFELAPALLEAAGLEDWDDVPAATPDR